MASKGKGIRALAASTKLKRRYLKHIKKMNKKKAPTWGQWKRKQDQKAMGGSRQMQQQLSDLSPSDFAAISKMRDKNKKRK